MIKLKKIFGIALILPLLSLCACTAHKTPVIPPVGWLFTHYQAPLTVDYDNTPVSNTVGKSATFFVRDPFITGLSVAWDDASLEASMKKGNLSKVDYADYQITLILGMFGHFEVRAYGE